MFFPITMHAYMTVEATILGQDTVRLPSHRGLLDLMVDVTMNKISNEISAYSVSNFPLRDAFTKRNDFPCHIRAWY
jgi:hypothetical protein